MAKGSSACETRLSLTENGAADRILLDPQILHCIPRFLESSQRYALAALVLTLAMLSLLIWS
jgi:hypothetical protein